jgi:FeS assembly SUF system regulator
MIRLGRLTDYSFVVLSRFAGERGEMVHNARDVAEEAGLPLPTVSKLLKILAQHSLLIASRGVKGGYRLARTPEEISVAEVIEALEGPVGITDCLSERESDCVLDGTCPCQDRWHVINDTVRRALSGITLAQMFEPVGKSRENLPERAGQCGCSGHRMEEAGGSCSCGLEKRSMEFEETN